LKCGRKIVSSGRDYRVTGRIPFHTACLSPFRKHFVEFQEADAADNGRHGTELGRQTDVAEHRAAQKNAYTAEYNKNDAENLHSEAPLLT
jgi:hypothetical protein